MLKKIDILLKQEKKIYHTQDLALLWNISARNTLLTIIKRYTKENILYRIYKGFYSTVPPNQLDPYEIGICAMHGYTYISVESVLLSHGIIQQHIGYITLISNKSRTFSIDSHHYKVRKLRDEFLYNETGTTLQNNIRIATIERAVADMLYYDNKFYFDGAKFIDWKKVENLQKTIGYR
ncbi:MAG: hypothetical protein HY738_17340 [Bacteroidia bacterium]|nr:hypothetical protein [Bacteroidia bacterium]